MKDTRQNRIWTFAGVFALALAVGVASDRVLSRRQERVSINVDQDLRDAVASPTPPATAGLAGKPVPTTWFKTPAEQKGEMDSALLSSRRRRALARRGIVP